MSDTSSKAREVYFQRLRQMTPSERLDLGVALWKAGDSLQRAAYRRMNPDADEAEVTFHLAVTRFGLELARKAYKSGKHWLAPVALLALIACAAMAKAQDPDDVKQKPADPAVIAAGKTQFGQTCGFCHGVNGRGASGPGLIHSALVSHDAEGNLIGQVVRNGRPDKGMPAFQMTDEQMRAIAAYLHSEASLAYSVYARGPGDYPVEKLLVGSAEAGKRFFSGAGKCATCHSTKGDLAHVATKYKPVDLQSKIAFPSGAAPTVTVTDAAGTVWTGPQVYADEFVVALRDTHGWVHTWKRSSVKAEIQDPLAAHEQLLFEYSDANLHDLFAYLETLK